MGVYGHIPTPPKKPVMNFQEYELFLDIIDNYGNLPDSQIKTAVYLTNRMRKILKAEKEGKNLKNQTIIYMNKICI
ncbi:hypothetical protein RI065_10435 [Mycoplasmatota bacterium zrk1]